MVQVTIMSPGLIDFHFLVSRCGSQDGARALFELLVTDIVSLEHPDVRQIAAYPGDWGIDAFIGDMTGGNVAVWQAKYYLDSVPTKRKADIVGAYKSAWNGAVRNGYTLTQWTLCVPSPLVPAMNKWWQKWVREIAQSDKVAVELWDETQLRRRLNRPGQNPQSLRDAYFNPMFTVPGTDTTGPDAEPVRWRDLDDEDNYGGSLFVHQLRTANLVETRSAREAFFNAEILEAEIADKALPRELDALKAWRSRIGATWEAEFNDAAGRTSSHMLTGLYNAVMSHIDQHHAADAKGLRARPLHGQGLLHQQVDAVRAGWVRNWRDIAKDFLDAQLMPTAPAQDTVSEPDGSAVDSAADAATGPQQIADAAPASTVTRMKEQL